MPGLMEKKIVKIPVYVLGALAVRVILAWLRRKLLRRPPQPFSFPLMGNLGYLPEPGKPSDLGTHQCMTNLARKLKAPVMGFWFGGVYTVVLSDYKAIHEALKTNAKAFAGRFAPPAIHTVTHGMGIAMQNDIEKWQRARGCLQAGLTKKIGNDDGARVGIINEEVQATGKEWFDLCQKNGGSWKSDVPLKGGPKKPAVRSMVGRESLNVYMRQMCSVRYKGECTDTYEDVRACLEQIFARISAGNPADYIPLMGLYGLIKPKILSEMTYWSDKMYGHIRSYIKLHKDAPVKEPRDFTDVMINQQSDFQLTDTDIEVIMWDVMAGGIDTTATTLEWLFYILCNYPETQKKLQDEMDSVVGKDKLPSWEEHRYKLPYLNAVLCELMRWKHFAPFGLPHMTQDDATVGGYNIPAGAQVLVNFHAAFMDPDAWEKPEEWNPDRFMKGGREEKLSRNLLDYDQVDSSRDVEDFKFIPYGCGMRKCVGWGVGRTVLWIKAATHLHCFKLEHPSGGKFNMGETFGVTLMPEEQSIKFTPREPAKLLKNIEDSLPSSILANI